MLILKGRYEFWFCLIALHKLGAIAVPATTYLQRKILYQKQRRKYQNDNCRKMIRPCLITLIRHSQNLLRCFIKQP